MAMLFDEDLDVTLRDVAFVPGLRFYLSSFNLIQEDHAINLDHSGTHILDGLLFFRKDIGN